MNFDNTQKLKSVRFKSGLHINENNIRIKDHGGGAAFKALGQTMKDGILEDTLRQI